MGSCLSASAEPSPSPSAELPKPAPDGQSLVRRKGRSRVLGSSLEPSWLAGNPPVGDYQAVASSLLGSPTPTAALCVTAFDADVLSQPPDALPEPARCRCELRAPVARAPDAVGPCSSGALDAPQHTLVLFLEGVGALELSCVFVNDAAADSLQLEAEQQEADLLRLLAARCTADGAFTRSLLALALRLVRDAVLDRAGGGPPAVAGGGSGREVVLCSAAGGVVEAEPVMLLRATPFGYLSPAAPGAGATRSTLASAAATTATTATATTSRSWCCSKEESGSQALPARPPAPHVLLPGCLLEMWTPPAPALHAVAAAVAALQQAERAGGAAAEQPLLERLSACGSGEQRSAELAAAPQAGGAAGRSAGGADPLAQQAPQGVARGAGGALALDELLALPLGCLVTVMDATGRPLRWNAASADFYGHPHPAAEVEAEAAEEESSLPVVAAPGGRPAGGWGLMQCLFALEPALLVRVAAAVAQGQEWRGVVRVAPPLPPPAAHGVAEAPVAVMPPGAQLLSDGLTPRTPPRSSCSWDVSLRTGLRGPPSTTAGHRTALQSHGTTARLSAPLGARRGDGLARGRGAAGGPGGLRRAKAAGYRPASAVPADPHEAAAALALLFARGSARAAASPAASGASPSCHGAAGLMPAGCLDPLLHPLPDPLLDGPCPLDTADSLLAVLRGASPDLPALCSVPWPRQRPPLVVPALEGCVGGVALIDPEPHSGPGAGTSARHLLRAVGLAAGQVEAEAGSGSGWRRGDGGGARYGGLAAAGGSGGSWGGLALQTLPSIRRQPAAPHLLARSRSASPAPRGGHLVRCTSYPGLGWGSGGARLGPEGGRAASGTAAASAVFRMWEEGGTDAGSAPHRALLATTRHIQTLSWQCPRMPWAPAAAGGPAGGPTGPRSASPAQPQPQPGAGAGANTQVAADGVAAPPRAVPVSVPHAAPLRAPQLQPRAHSPRPPLPALTGEVVVLPELLAPGSLRTGHASPQGRAADTDTDSDAGGHPALSALGPGRATLPPSLRLGCAAGGGSEIGGEAGGCGGSGGAGGTSPALRLLPGDSAASSSRLLAGLWRPAPDAGAEWPAASGAAGAAPASRLGAAGPGARLVRGPASPQRQQPQQQQQQRAPGGLPAGGAAALASGAAQPPWWRHNTPPPALLPLPAMPSLPGLPQHGATSGTLSTLSTIGAALMAAAAAMQGGRASTPGGRADGPRDTEQQPHGAPGLAPQHSLAAGACGPAGDALPEEGEDEDEDAACCWHEVVVQPRGGTGGEAAAAAVVVVVQTDITRQVRAEQLLARVLRAEQRLLAELFPPHGPLLTPHQLGGGGMAEAQAAAAAAAAAGDSGPGGSAGGAD